MAGSSKVFGIDIKRDADAIVLGAVAMMVLAVLPIPGDPIGALLAKIRMMVKGN